MAVRKKKRIAIIYSAFSPDGSCDEQEASGSILEDAERVREILLSRGDHAFCIPLLRGVDDFYENLASSGADLIFNLCEGAMGDSRHEMNICSLLDLRGIPYTGCGPLALGMALDKGLTKRLLISERIPTPRYFVCDRSVPSKLPQGMSYPLFVKPVREDASLGIDRDAFVMNNSELKKRCRFILKCYRQPALVEEYIEGRELNVSIIGNSKPVILPISEIDMSRIPSGRPRVCDYRAKWVAESEEYNHTVPICPAPLKKVLERKIKETALKCYLLMSCRGYARVDIRLSRSNVPYVLEVNPNPCIGLDAGIVRSAAAAGLSYEDLVCKIADLGLYGD